MGPNNRRIPICCRPLALTFLAVLPGLSATIPILDVMVGDGRPAAESRHIPGTHGYAHNHLICIQHTASGWAKPSPTLMPWTVLGIRLPDLPDPELPIPDDQISLPFSRAPPTA